MSRYFSVAENDGWARSEEKERVSCGSNSLTAPVGAERPASRQEKIFPFFLMLHHNLVTDEENADLEL